MRTKVGSNTVPPLEQSRTEKNIQIKDLTRLDFDVVRA